MVSQKISKEVFLQVIEHLHQQYLQDKEYVDGISSLYATDMPFYDNSHLLKSSLELLRLFFPKDENGFCDIEFYCYVCEFGKIGEIKDASELYDYLVTNKENKRLEKVREIISKCSDCIRENGGVKCVFCLRSFDNEDIRKVSLIGKKA